MQQYAFKNGPFGFNCSGNLGLCVLLATFNFIGSKPDSRSAYRMDCKSSNVRRASIITHPYCHERMCMITQTKLKLEFIDLYGHYSG